MMGETITFRKAGKKDAGRIWQIILQAKERMKLLGSRQWQDGYPVFEDIVHDVDSGYGCVLCCEDSVVAYGAIVFDGEPAYGSIDGKWLNEEPYVVVHRLAVADEMKQRGIATVFMQEVEKLSVGKGVYEFRVDTNFDNLYMRKMMTRLEFTYCGEIMYDNALRMAYQKSMK